VIASLLLSLLFGAAQAAEPKPLPELGPFLAEVRKNLRSDRMLLSQYTYTEKDTERRFDRKGGTQKEEVAVREIYPSLEPGLTFRKLVSRNGRAVSPAEIEKQEREHDKKVRERTRRLEREGADERARRIARENQERKREDEIIDEMFRMYAITMAGRETVSGLPAIMLDFQMRPDHKPRSRETKLMARVAGRAWVGESDFQLIRVDARSIGDISLGFGLLAKLAKGARMQFQRVRVNDEVWLPASARFTGSARILMLKGLNVDVLSEYSDYRKFSVRTSVSFDEGKKP
jgi:hypothetical protein